MTVEMNALGLVYMLTIIYYTCELQEVVGNKHIHGIDVGKFQENCECFQEC